ncbi:MAG: replication-associated recombination protein A [Opitutaceae bacterium]|jgi:putative ATPase
MPSPDQSDLFGEPAAVPASAAAPRSRPATQPLAARMRPRVLADIVGQEHLTQADGLLTRLIKSNRFGSLIFYGPPGCGKTSFAEVIAHETQSRFVRVNAVMSNVAELRDILATARKMPDTPTLLFIDELHRFNKSQQDLLLPDVEEGYVRLIGATTHNPGFYVNPPLLSRSHLFRLQPLATAAVASVLARALADSERGLGARKATADAKVLADLAVLCDGDLRRALNALEVIVLSLPEGAAITEGEIEVFARERRIRYDADEDEHYDTISAFIKSCRGSDPDAAMYWLAKMLAGGEDPRFIARRLVILASEDVGLADPLALPLAVAAHHACDFIGLPEAELTLAHATLHIACAPKSNSATLALAAAHQALKTQPVQPVPLPLRDKSGQASKQAGHGKGYRYSHDYPENISGQDYLEKPLALYTPKSAGLETRIVERLARWRELKAQMKG